MLFHKCSVYVYKGVVVLQFHLTLYKGPCCLLVLELHFFDTFHSNSVEVSLLHVFYQANIHSIIHCSKAVYCLVRNLWLY